MGRLVRPLSRSAWNPHRHQGLTSFRVLALQALDESVALAVADRPDGAEASVLESGLSPACRLIPGIEPGAAEQTA